MMLFDEEGEALMIQHNRIKLLMSICTENCQQDAIEWRIRFDEYINREDNPYAGKLRDTLYGE